MVSAAAVASSPLLPIKDNGQKYILIVHTQTLSSGKHTTVMNPFLQLMYISAHIAKWVAESNHPPSIISDPDPDPIVIFMTRHPHLKVPSPKLFDMMSRQLTWSAVNMYANSFKITQGLYIS